MHRIPDLLGWLKFKEGVRLLYDNISILIGISWKFFLCGGLHFRDEVASSASLHKIQ